MTTDGAGIDDLFDPLISIQHSPGFGKESPQSPQAKLCIPTTVHIQPNSEVLKTSPSTGGSSNYHTRESHARMNDAAVSCFHVAAVPAVSSGAGGVFARGGCGNLQAPCQHRGAPWFTEPRASLSGSVLRDSESQRQWRMARGFKWGWSVGGH